MLLNDPIYVEAARVFAQNMLRDERTLDARIDRAFERTVSRPPPPTSAAPCSTCIARAWPSSARRRPQPKR